MNSVPCCGVEIQPNLPRCFSTTTPIAKGQLQARPFPNRLGRKKGIENLCPNGVRNPATGIGDRNPHPRIANRIGPHLNPIRTRGIWIRNSSSLGGFNSINRVSKKIHQNLIELTWETRHERQFAIVSPYEACRVLPVQTGDQAQSRH